MASFPLSYEIMNMKYVIYLVRDYRALQRREMCFLMHDLQTGSMWAQQLIRKALTMLFFIPEQFMLHLWRTLVKLQSEYADKQLHHTSIKTHFLMY